MKVLLFVSSLYGGGMERIAAVLASYLVQRHQVIVADFSDNKHTYPIDPRVDICDISPKCIRLFRSWVRLHNIRSIIKSADPDVIISFSVSLNAKVIKANKGLRKKIIVSERTTVSRKLSKEAEIARLKLYPQTDCVVYVTKEDFDNCPHVKNKTVIYNPLLFEPCHETTSRTKSIVAIGGLNRWEVKGFDLLLKAWSKICNNHKDWYLEFLGKDCPGVIHDMVHQYHLDDCVRFLGRSDDIQDVLRHKSVFVLSSRNEGFPNSLIEAMSQGCACIAFDCQTGPKEIITDGVSGLLVENGSVDDLASKMDIVLRDELLRSSLSKGAIEEVQRFNYDTIMQEWSDLIEKINNS